MPGDSTAVKHNVTLVVTVCADGARCVRSCLFTSLWINLVLSGWNFSFSKKSKEGGDRIRTKEGKFYDKRGSVFFLKKAVMNGDKWVEYLDAWGRHKLKQVRYPSLLQANHAKARPKLTW